MDDVMDDVAMFNVLDAYWVDVVSFVTCQSVLRVLLWKKKCKALCHVSSSHRIQYFTNVQRDVP